MLVCCLFEFSFILISIQGLSTLSWAYTSAIWDVFLRQSVIFVNEREEGVVLLH